MDGLWEWMVSRENLSHLSERVSKGGEKRLNEPHNMQMQRHIHRLLGFWGLPVVDPLILGLATGLFLHQGHPTMAKSPDEPQ